MSNSLYSIVISLNKSFDYSYKKMGRVDEKNENESDIKSGVQYKTTKNLREQYNLAKKWQGQ